MLVTVQVYTNENNVSKEIASQQVLLGRWNAIPTSSFLAASRNRMTIMYCTTKCQSEFNEMRIADIPKSSTLCELNHARPSISTAIIVMDMTLSTFKKPNSAPPFLQTNVRSKLIWIR